MRLLIVTQIVDPGDPILGFFHEWILVFAKECESVEVICLKEGAHTLPGNVRVHSLGKERGSSFFGRIFLFYKYIFSLRNRYDAVFVHMNPEYVALGGLFWRVRGTPIGLWYTHKTVSVWLRIATAFTNFIFTASSESFRLQSPKVHVTGHGIPLVDAVPHTSRTDMVRIVSAGRIAEIKNIHRMFDVLTELKANGVPAELTLFGEALTESDRAYAEKLRARVQKEQLPVIFAGAVPNKEIFGALREHEVFLNCSETGALDKAILEAWASGLYVVTINEGVRSVGKEVDPSLPCAFDAKILAEKIASWRTTAPDVQENYRLRARAYIETSHGLERLVKEMVAILRGSSKG